VRVAVPNGGLGSTRIAARAFVTRWRAGGKVEVAGGAFLVQEDCAGGAGRKADAPDGARQNATLSAAPLFTVRQLHHFMRTVGLAVHRRGDRRTDGIIRRSQWIG
jgi:hypothetical protein